MGFGTTFVGREQERSVALAALVRGRSVLVVGPRRSGRTRTLASITADVAGPVHRLERGTEGVWWIEPDGRRRTWDDHSDIPAVLDALGDEAIVVVDDLDRLPTSVLSPVVDALLRGKTVFVAGLCPRHVAAADETSRWNAMRPLYDQPAGVALTVPLLPLGLRETSVLSDALRTERYDADPADDAWQTALHRVAGGSPALVREIVEAAASRGSLNAVQPLAPRSDALPASVSTSGRHMLASVSERDLSFLVALAELGPIPTGHLGAIVPVDTLTRLHDGGLLLTGSGGDTTTVSDLLARLAEDRLDDAAWNASRRAVARDLLALSRNAPVLTTGEEMFCAQWGQIGDDDGLASAHSSLLPRAALALARAGRACEAVRVADTARSAEQDLTAWAALTLAQLSRGDAERAASLLDAMPLPRTRTERELALTVHMRVRFAQSSGCAVAEDRVGALTSWAPDDETWAWRLRVAIAARSLESSIAPPSAEHIAAPHPAADDRTLILADDCHAVFDAATGNRRVGADRRGRPRGAHALGMESDASVFRLHALALVMIGEDVDAVRSATRRRLLAAGDQQRQDAIAPLAVIDAAVQLLRNRPADALRSLQLVERYPSEAIRLWRDLLRAAAFAMTDELVAASAAIERLAVAAGTAGLGGFAAVFSLVCAVFERANRRHEAASAHVDQAIDRARGTMPIVIPFALRVWRDSGVSDAQVLARAEALLPECDIAPLRDLVDDLRGSAGSGGRRLELLTSREREIVLLVVGGRSNAEIAEMLHLSVRTVESHLHHARVRLGMDPYERFALTPATRPVGR